MKIRVILIFLFISFLLFSSFSQTKPILQVFDGSKVCDGYILWMGESKCQLIDRKGNTLFNIPGNLVSFFNNKEEIASHSDGNLVVFNKNLDVIWKSNTYIHHELTITPGDKIMLLSGEILPINHINLRFDVILHFDSTGKEIFNWSTFDNRRYLLNFIMKDKNIFRYKIKGSSDPDSILFNMAPGLKNPELFHMNAIQEIPENESEKKDSAFREGNILLSFCNYNKSISSFIAIVDPVNYKILWYYVQKDRKPMHTPTMLPNGHILVYVNSTGFLAKTSIIEEVDPITKEIVWKYTEKFLKTKMCSGFGSCQRLPNGNTFISNCQGYVYEVTPDKNIIWKWFANKKMDAKHILYRAYWYPKEKLNWILNDE